MRKTSFQKLIIAIKEVCRGSRSYPIINKVMLPVFYNEVNCMLLAPVFCVVVDFSAALYLFAWNPITSLYFYFIACILIFLLGADGGWVAAYQISVSLQKFLDINESHDLVWWDDERYHVRCSYFLFLSQKEYIT